MRLRYFAVSLLCFVVGTAGAQAGKSASAGKSPELRVDFIEDQLPNGLKVIYHVDHSTPVAAVDLWYNVGSKMEQQRRTGFAHLFEHMMFQGSKNVPKGQHFGLLEAAGGRGGADINGTTNTDRTNYFEQVPSNQLELALWLEADRMGTLLETVAEADSVRLERLTKAAREAYLDLFPVDETMGTGPGPRQDKLELYFTSEHRERQRRYWLWVLAELRGIPLSNLSPTERLTHRLLWRENELALAGLGLPLHQHYTPGIRQAVGKEAVQAIEITRARRK